MSSVVAAGAIIGAVIGGVSSAFGLSKGNKQLMEIYKEKMKYAQMNYNYNINQLDRAEKASYDAAIAEIFNISSAAMQNESTMEVALSEAGYEGKTSEQSKRSLSALSLNQITNTKAAEEADIASIYAKKDQLYMSFKNTLEQERKITNDSFTTGFQAIMQIGQGAAMGAAMGAAGGAALSAAGGAAGGAAAGTGAGAAGGAGASAAGGSAAALEAVAPELIGVNVTPGLMLSPEIASAAAGGTSSGLAASGTVGGTLGGTLATSGKTASTTAPVVNTSQVPLSQAQGFGGWWARYQKIYSTKVQPYMEAYQALNQGMSNINQQYYSNRYKGSY